MKKYKNRDVNPERIYMAEWRKRNRERLSTGRTLLELILCPDDVESPPAISRRDAAVAASIVQWLGTNCGLGFIWTCEQKIEKARDREAENHYKRLMQLREEREIERRRREEEKRQRRATRLYRSES